MVELRSAQRTVARAETRGLPIVDIGGLRDPRASQRRRAEKALGRAAHEHGFLYIKNHGIEQALIDAVLRQARRFFALPSTEKNAYYIGKSNCHRGYVPVTEKGDYADEGKRMYEAFDLGVEHPDPPESHDDANVLDGPNVWPSLFDFQDVVETYISELHEVGKRLTAGFESYLGVRPGTLSNCMNRPISQLRLLHYLPNERGDDPRAKGSDSKMGAHTDYECFTVLYLGGPGLQVLDKAGQWMNVEPIEGTYVINVGDMLETWSNGHLVSTLHRVIDTGEERFSLPFFVAANYDAVIEPLPSPKLGQASGAYQPIVAGQHLVKMLLRDFPYLRKRYLSGALKLPVDCIPRLNPFEAGRVLALNGAH